MGFDRNTVIGFVLLAVLFFGYFFYSSSSQQKLAAEKQRYNDSVAKANPPKIDTVKQRKDSAAYTKQADALATAGFGDTTQTEILNYAENELMKLTFSNKGGWLKMVELKNYKNTDSGLVKMGGSEVDNFAYSINTSANQSTTTDKIYFAQPIIAKAANGSTTITYNAANNGRTLTHSFVIKPADYLIDANIALTGADQLLTAQTINILWTVKARQQQKDQKYERLQQKIVTSTGGEFDYWTAANGASEKLSLPTQFIGLKQQFFNSTILAKNNFNSVEADVVIPTDSSAEVGRMKTVAHINVPPGNTASIPLQIYYGPNDYKLLKSYNNNMQGIVDLGSGMYAFVKFLNKGFVLPVFDFLKGLVGGKTGWAILILTFIIRLLISPLTYKSYLSGAKMKVLQPEIKTLKAKFGTDTQGFSMEQMKLFREAGVNPLGGCIPALLQIPIFFALYAFFNSYLGLRGESFLWSHDLSMYDYPIHFGNIPVISTILGNHISLFSVTACATSFLISIYSMSTTPDQSNPMMKYLPYIFPVVMLFIFNNLPSALTWYYTVSNIITLAIQYVINNYIINHDKILAQMMVNRTKPKTKSKWQERIEAAQQTQKKVQDMRNKNGKK